MVAVPAQSANVDEAFIPAMADRECMQARPPLRPWPRGAEYRACADPALELAGAELLHARELLPCAAAAGECARVRAGGGHRHRAARQVVPKYRKPLVIATPKSLLRSPDARSPLADFAEGTWFKRVIPEPAALPSGGVRKLIFCSGKARGGGSGGGGTKVPISSQMGTILISRYMFAI